MKTNNIHCLYLYQDGHAVVVFEERHRGMHLKYVEIIERLVAPDARLHFTGRIVFGMSYPSGFYTILKGAKRVEAKTPDLSHGSEKTKALNIKVATLSVTMANNTVLTFDDMPDLLSGPFTYDEGQMTYGEAFDPDLRTWCDYPVSRIHRAKHLGVRSKE